MSLTKFFYDSISFQLLKRTHLSKRATGDRQIWVVVVIFLLIPSLVLHASVEPKVAPSVDLIFGPEWTFTNSQMVNAVALSRARCGFMLFFRKLKKN